MVRSKKPLHIFFLAVIAFLSISTYANPVIDTAAVATEGEVNHEVKEEKKDLKSEIKEFIGHHLLDSYDFHLFSYEDDSKKEHHVGFPLPVILFDNGLHVFSSAGFHGEEHAVESNGNFYKVHHGKIYKVANEHAQVSHEDKPVLLDFSITKNVFVIFLVVLLMFFLFKGLAKSYTKNNGIASGVGRFFEPLVLFIRDEIAIPNIGEKHYKKYMSFLLTVFFFIWFLNMFGLTPIGINVTGNIAITFSLAIITYLITNLSANKNYWGHIFWMPGVPAPMKLILMPIELLGTIIKPFSLMIRLYANMLAGHVVIMSIIGLMFIFKSWIGSPLSFFLAFFLSILEVLVAFLQAYIFTMLASLYFGAANEEHHHDDHH